MNGLAKLELQIEQRGVPCALIPYRSTHTAHKKSRIKPGLKNGLKAKIVA
jgi:hypothetical protein